MTDTLQKDIERAHEKLREIDGKMYGLGGRVQGVGGGPDRAGFKRRISSGPGDQWSGNDRNDSRRVTITSESGGRRRVDMDRGEDRFAKRSRMDDNYGGDDDFDGRPKRTLQSTVVMPSIETKSREQKIEELAKTEKTEVKSRNRRMFSNLLMGTLTSFQKKEREDARTKVAEQKQAEKLIEIEKRLDDKKREEKQKAEDERRSLQDQRRAAEKELRALNRQKALIQYAEAKQEHYRLLSQSIQTQAKPTIFFLPAKHSVRSLELLKNSQKAIEVLIDLRQKELERDLAANVGDHDHSDGEGETMKSMVVSKNGGGRGRRSSPDGAATATQRGRRSGSFEKSDHSDSGSEEEKKKKGEEKENGVADSVEVGQDEKPTVEDAEMDDVMDEKKVEEPEQQEEEEIHLIE